VIAAIDPSTTALLVAVISAVGAIVVAAITRTGKRIEEKIEGIRNGLPSEVKVAIARLLREKTERQLYGLPLRRVGDHVGEPADEATRSADEVRDVLHTEPGER
jgi:hypothetical protein